MHQETPVWPDVARAYLTHLKENHDPLQELVNAPRLLRLLEMSGDREQVLDMGCADGSFTWWIYLGSHHRHGRYFHPARVFAFDISEEMLEDALGKFWITYFFHDINNPNYDYINRLGLEDGSCSHVVCKMVFPSLENVYPAIKLARKLLRDGGKFIVSTLDDSYIQQYTIPRFQKWHAGLQNILYDQEVRRELGIKDDQEAMAFYTHSMHELNERPGAIWTTIAGSRFMIPIYLHPNDYVKERMMQAGFRLVESEHIKITPEFAERFPQYQDRVGMSVLWDTVWEKLPRDEGIGRLHHEEDFDI
jgi:2-polyprenyl-3-methyl-5-hydroxy-6-metoxy-1,4-benzoquinol methylase